MKKVISLSLIILTLGIIVGVVIVNEAKPVLNETNPRAQVTVSPCASPIGNRGNPCETYKPSKEEIEERARRMKEWNERQKKVLTADFPLKNETSIDIDGDGKQDKILYRIQPWKDDFEGLLKITSGENKVLWEHEFFMSSRDLTKFLLEVLSYDSVTDWVKNVFNKQENYSFKVATIKIKKSDLDNDQVAYAASLYKIDPEKLKAEILSQKANYVYVYRAEWREDLMQIVYVPSLNKFICFSRGY